MKWYLLYLAYNNMYVILFSGQWLAFTAYKHHIGKIEIVGNISNKTQEDCVNAINALWPSDKYGVGDLSKHKRNRAIIRNNVDLTVWNSSEGTFAGNAQNTDY